MYKEFFGLYEFGCWRQPLLWPFFFDEGKERMFQKASVNVSCKPGLISISYNICFPKDAHVFLPILFGVCADIIYVHTLYIYT